MTHGNLIYAMAAEINSMREGQDLVIDRRMIQNLPGNWITGEKGWDRVLENVIGSAHTDLWRFETDIMTGNMHISKLNA